MDLLALAHGMGRRACPANARTRSALAGALLCAVSALTPPDAALADKISNPIAVFDGLDKITGRIISFEVGINETVQFGALQITPRVCYSRPPTDAPQTDAFAQVDEIDEQKQIKRIFSGWMFADSPGLHGVEHPVYDVWLTDCAGPAEPHVAEPAVVQPTPAVATTSARPPKPRQTAPARAQAPPAGQGPAPAPLPPPQQR